MSNSLVASKWQSMNQDYSATPGQNTFLRKCHRVGKQQCNTHAMHTYDCSNFSIIHNLVARLIRERIHSRSLTPGILSSGASAKDAFKATVGFMFRSVFQLQTIV